MEILLDVAEWQVLLLAEQPLLLRLLLQLLLLMLLLPLLLLTPPVPSLFCSLQVRFSAVAIAAAASGLLRRVTYSPSCRCSTVSLTHWPANTLSL